MPPESIAMLVGVSSIFFGVPLFMYKYRVAQFKKLAAAISGKYVKNFLKNTIIVGPYELDHHSGGDSTPSQMIAKRQGSDTTIGEVCLLSDGDSASYSVKTINCPIPDEDIPCELINGIFENLKGSHFSVRINQFECIGSIVGNPSHHDQTQKMIAGTEALHAHFLELSQQCT